MIKIVREVNFNVRVIVAIVATFDEAIDMFDSLILAYPNIRLSILFPGE